MHIVAINCINKLIIARVNNEKVIVGGKANLCAGCQPLLLHRYRQQILNGARRALCHECRKAQVCPNVSRGNYFSLGCFSCASFWVCILPWKFRIAGFASGGEISYCLVCISRGNYFFLWLVLPCDWFCPWWLVMTCTSLVYFPLCVAGFALVVKIALSWDCSS